MHIAQQMPLPLTVSCSSKSRLVLTLLVLPFWYLLTRVVPDKFQKSSKTIVCCVCVCVKFFMVWFVVIEEELKRLNEALADDNSYSAVSFDYDCSSKTAEETSEAETSHGQSSR